MTSPPESDAADFWIHNAENLGHQPLPDWLLRLRIPILAAMHVVVFGAAYWIAFLLRFDFKIGPDYYQLMGATLPFVVGVQILAFVVFRTFHGWWRYVTFRDLVSFINPLALSFVVVWSANLLFLSSSVPRSVLLIDFVLSGLLISLVRSSWRVGSEGLSACGAFWQPRLRAFLISNHHDTLVLANQINSSRNSTAKIVGLLTFEKHTRGATRAGIPVVGSPQDAGRLASRYRVKEVWLVAGSIPGQLLSELKPLYDSLGLKTRVIPASLERHAGGGFVPIREIAIDDLLQRPAVALDSSGISAELTGKRILVTGAGGSIGSEISRQLLPFQPSELMLLDHRENSVFLIHNELTGLNEQATVLHPAVADILDTNRMHALFNSFRPDIVYHAAAHKHVGLMELQPGEAIKNNISGTRQVADLANEYGAEKFVMVSTDKAVCPTSVMGCTKQIAERYVLALGSQSLTRYVVVRFGNVLGSNGSVVPLFKEQIARGGPITITDPRMTRFFMTIPEASQLVLQAGCLGAGGEIFVLDMGEQVKILDLAKKMIQLAGLPESAIEIRIMGARPGEKLYEELYLNDECSTPTVHRKIFSANHRPFEYEDVMQCVDRLEVNSGQSPDRLRKVFAEYIPEYQRSSETKPPVNDSLDSFVLDQPSPGKLTPRTPSRGERIGLQYNTPTCSQNLSSER